MFGERQPGGTAWMMEWGPAKMPRGGKQWQFCQSCDWIWLSTQTCRLETVHQKWLPSFNVKTGNKILQYFTILPANCCYTNLKENEIVYYALDFFASVSLDWIKPAVKLQLKKRHKKNPGEKVHGSLERSGLIGRLPICRVQSSELTLIGWHAPSALARQASGDICWRGWVGIISHPKAAEPSVWSRSRKHDWKKSHLKCRVNFRQPGRKFDCDDASDKRVLKSFPFISLANMTLI